MGKVAQADTENASVDNSERAGGVFIKQNKYMVMSSSFRGDQPSQQVAPELAATKGQIPLPMNIISIASTGERSKRSFRESERTVTDKDSNAVSLHRDADYDLSVKRETFKSTTQHPAPDKIAMMNRKAESII